MALSTLDLGMRTLEMESRNRVSVRSHVDQSGDPERFRSLVARFATVLEGGAVRRLVALGALGSPDFVEGVRQWVIRRFAVRKYVTLGALETVVSAEKCEMLAVIEVSWRIELILAVTLLAIARQTVRVDVLVTGRAFLRQSDEALVSRIVRESGERERLVSRVILPAGQSVVLSIETELDVWMLEDLAVVISPCEIADQREVLSDVLDVAGGAIELAGVFHDVMVETLLVLELVRDLRVAVEARLGDRLFAVARNTTLEIRCAIDACVRVREVAWHGRVHRYQTDEDDDQKRAYDEGSSWVQKH
jgi:hypothetical protein